ncbi:hypothetical protein AF72_05890 [Xylella taiwanensis]|uniref:Uncharacterized protein n=1 Tax=Xylella taiwanensis TaxID=1444770 RepID=Z9JKM6_9GAMM|nr:hypothetical protein AF72_05890 [Xylella taiwanensis]
MLQVWRQCFSYFMLQKSVMVVLDRTVYGVGGEGGLCPVFA